ncbi:hypothetical protein WJX72_009490 [[Myrmecia] bisecta]|uniref:Uncharacterized protein n=1 Tax=[Myrmecia] bisecta TaxID=41462 RepID=A0AAW1R929_9CHLO
MTAELSKHMWQQWKEIYCGLFDFVIIGETQARGRPLLEGRCQSTQIILLVQNRFDILFWAQEIDHAAVAEWVGAVNMTLKTMPNVHVVVNNPYEKLYASVKGIDFSEAPLIRPVGVVSVVPNPTFYKQLWDEGALDINPFGQLHLTFHVKDWWKYWDWYHEDFAGLFVYFDSWQHLKEVQDSFDFEAQRSHNLEKMLCYSEDILGWLQYVYGEIVANRMAQSYKY